MSTRILYKCFRLVGHHIKYQSVVKQIFQDLRFLSSTATATTSKSNSKSLGAKPQQGTFTKMMAGLGDAGVDVVPTPTSRHHVKIQPPGVIHNWDLRQYTPQDIRDKTQEIIDNLKVLFDKAANATELNFKNVFEPLLEAHRYSFGVGALVTFPRHVAVSGELRQAASDATRVLDEFGVETSMRKDIFDKLVLYRENQAPKENLDPEYLRCLDRLIQNGRRCGLHLSEKVRDEVKWIKMRVSELTLQFSRNLGEDNTTLLFSPEELGGMTYAFLEGLDKCPETGKLKVTLKYPHFFPVTRKCFVAETRKTLETAYQSKCLVENTKLLEDILELRQREAELLGYPNHATYIQEILMAKNPDNVAAFLDDLTKKLQPLWQKELQMMLEMKEKECEKYSMEFNGKIDFWDFRYYMCQLEEELYTVDQEQIMEYFPLECVTNGMLNIYQELLSLEFTRLPTAEKWHEDVDVYQVKDGSDSEILGYFYLDLYPRDGKFGHACCVPLQFGCLDSDGVKQPAVAAMLTNFMRPRGNRPSLLDHKQLETYVHELGHLMHTICSRAKTAVLFGTRVETDFVEVPSQMLENWVWEKEPLLRMSGHYETGEPLPNDLIEKLSLSKKANAGAFNLRQIVLAAFDQQIHLGGRVNTQELYAKILKDIMGLDAIPNTSEEIFRNFAILYLTYDQKILKIPNAHSFLDMAANFNHLCVGYSGRYYSYLWSEVFSMDMYKTMFETKGIFNPEMGLKYRKCILEPGASQDAMEMLKNVLGREPNNTAFLESKGLDQVEPSTSSSTSS